MPVTVKLPLDMSPCSVIDSFDKNIKYMYIWDIGVSILLEHFMQCFYIPCCRGRVL